MKKDFKKWEPNISCSIWGNPCKVEKPDNCPEPDKHSRCDDDDKTCPHFMGLDTSKKNIAHWGDTFPGCCWRLIELKQKEKP